MQTTLRYCWILAFIWVLLSCEDGSEDTPAPGRSYDYALSDGEYAGEVPLAGGDGDSTVQPPEPGQITAGEWNDLAHWDFWKNLKDNEDWQTSRSTWGFTAEQRYRLRVLDRYNRPVVDARATLYDVHGGLLWEAHTDAEGVAELWGKAMGSTSPSQSISVDYYGQTATLDALSPFEQGEMTLKLDTERNCPDRIDLMFAVDATGSMMDELDYLQSELTDVIARIEPTATVRLGTVFYRDEGDAYVVRAFPFTSNIPSMIENIQAQSADGGGDWPEAVHTALEEAIVNQQWSESATARLLFLLLDAPPHDNQDVKSDMQRLIRKASRQGVRIIPISASGIDKPTEFLLRAMSILTQGTYVFVTDHSGIGNDHLEPTVGEYDVELLNDLLVRLINQYGAKCGVER